MMLRFRPIIWVILVAITLLVTSCSKAPGQPPSVAQPGAEPTAGKYQAVKVNMDEIFPPGSGRDLVLNNCTTCHTITPIVMVQMTREARERWARDHRERVPVLTDQEFKVLTEYLVENFNPSKPVPQLPKELLDTWTSY